MEELVRFGVSMPASLLTDFDRVIQRKGYTNRSEAIRDMIRDAIVEHEWMENKEVVGTVTIVFDHHKKGVMEKLTDLQHQYHNKIASSTHIHLDHENCLEVIVVRGKPSQIKALADKMIALKGVKHGKLVVTSPLSHIE
jgi:CopG family nickel-responsive transcriptional regulator